MLSSVLFHKSLAPLRFLTHEIGEIGVDFDVSLSAEAISALIHEPHKHEFGWQSTAQSALKGRIERENDHCFKVALFGRFLVKTTCVRCLTPLTMPIAIDFSIRMLEKEHLGFMGEPDDRGEDGALEIDMSKDEEDVVGYFSGTCIDVGLILRDQIFLEVPDYPQCASTRCSLPKGNILGAEGLDRHDGYGNNPFVKLFKKT